MGDGKGKDFYWDNYSGEINPRDVELEAKQAVVELARMKAEIREAKAAYNEYMLVNRRPIPVSIRPDLRQPAFKDPTPVDPMFQRFACIEV